MMVLNVFFLILCAINIIFVSGDGMPYDTIVVGLGSAGAMAASTLAKAGKRVLALEAQDRVGGRVHTVPFGDGVVEVGAEWIHGQYPSLVYETAQKHNIKTLEQNMEFKIYRSDGEPAGSTIDELVAVAFEYSEEGSEVDEPLGDLITSKITNYVKTKHPQLLEENNFLNQFLEFMNLIVDNYEASNDWNDVNARSNYEDPGGSRHMSWHRVGYKTFFDLLLETYKNGTGIPTLEVKLNTEVTQILWPQDPDEKVLVATKDGVTYQADNVIVTVSLGVLKERYASLFYPSLPEIKVTAIQALAIGTVDKITLAFERPWWPDHEFYAFLWYAEDKHNVKMEDRWITNILGASCPRGAINTITVWTSGEVGKMIETLPDEVVKTKATELLRQFLGKRTTVPEPLAMIRSKWYENPFTRGAYTFDSLSAAVYPNARSQLATPLIDRSGKPRVLFAGEATSEHSFGTVHGAAATGLREANRILECKA